MRVCQVYHSSGLSSPELTGDLVTALLSIDFELSEVSRIHSITLNIVWSNTIVLQLDLLLAVVVRDDGGHSFCVEDRIEALHELTVEDQFVRIRVRVQTEGSLSNVGPAGGRDGEDIAGRLGLGEDRE